LYSFLLNKDIGKESLLPCYFFYGEEVFLARQFLDELKDLLLKEDQRDFAIQRFSLLRETWMDVFDSARTISFFPTMRIFEVEIPLRREKLNKTEGQILKSYFEDPTPQTVMVFIHPHKLPRNAALIKLFSSLPAAEVKELKPLRAPQISSWVDRRIGLSGKSASQEAKDRLIELAGSDLTLINNELNKLVTYIGDKTRIELDDVNQVSGWVKSFVEWEVTNNLEVKDYDQSLLVLDKLINKEGVKPEYILGIMAKFFRELFLAKQWLRERSKDRKAIFKLLRPHIQEKFGGFYRAKYSEFFRLADGFSMEEISLFVEELERIDLKLKTTDLSPLILFEGFLFRFCREGEAGTISKGWR
jgi:DNA polymerase III delta subunit